MNWDLRATDQVDDRVWSLLAGFYFAFVVAAVAVIVVAVVCGPPSDGQESAPATGNPSDCSDYHQESVNRFLASSSATDTDADTDTDANIANDFKLNESG